MNLLAKSFAKHKSITPHTVKYLEEGVHHTGKEALIHLFKEMIRDMLTGIPETLKQPMLILYGDHEVGMLQRLQIKWHANTPNSQIVRVKNAHHITNQDNPEEVNKALLSFLEGLDSSYKHN
jgi:pimeloyl-ACP methyl ester carboxylesterase